MPENVSIDVEPTSALAPGATMPSVADELGSRVPSSLDRGFDPIAAITRARQAKIPESPEQISLTKKYNQIIKQQKEVDEAKRREQQDEARAISNYSRDVARQLDARNQAFQNEPLPTFAPTQENAQSLAGLFGLLGVVGAMAGKGGGQQSAIASMNAMTGMMKGWQQGRADLYQQEKDKFEKNFQTVKAKHEQLEKDFAAAMEKAKYDLQGATADAKLAAIKEGSDVLSKSIELNGLIKTAELLKQNVEDRKNLESIYLQFELEQQKRLESAGKPIVAENDGKFYYVNPVTGKSLTDDKGAVLRAPAPAAQARAESLPRATQSDRQADSSRSLLVPQLENILPTLRELGKSSDKWGVFSAAMLADPRVAEQAFKDNPDVLNMIRVFAKFRGKEFETAGKALTRKEDEILRPLYQVGGRPYAAVENAVIEGIEEMKNQSELARKSVSGLPAASWSVKPMPTGEKLNQYANEHFNGDTEKATNYLKSQGYK